MDTSRSGAGRVNMRLATVPLFHTLTAISHRLLQFTRVTTDRIFHSRSPVVHSHPNDHINGAVYGCRVAAVRAVVFRPTFSALLNLEIAVTAASFVEKRTTAFFTHHWLYGL